MLHSHLSHSLHMSAYQALMILHIDTHIQGLLRLQALHIQAFRNPLLLLVHHLLLRLLEIRLCDLHPMLFPSQS
jgi:hypothetical protein